MVAYIQAINSQITNNVATTQGGGINAATCDGLVLVNTQLSSNFGDRFPDYLSFNLGGTCT